MQLEFRMTGLDPTPHLVKWFRDVLLDAAKRVTLDTASVGRIIIASHDRFGEAVHAVKPGETHTDTEDGVAGGKTISRKENGRVVTDIVFQRSLFDQIAEVLNEPPATRVWNVDQLEALYVLCHEFGHAKDHALRDDVSENPDPRQSTFSINAAADYYGHILLTEFAACRHSASEVRGPLFDHQLELSSTRMLNNQKLVNHHLDNLGKLSYEQLMHFVCQGTWFNMVELAKHYANSIGHADRETDMREFENGTFNENALGDILVVVGNSYPAWDVPAITTDLSDIWHRYVEFSGVTFTPGPDGDEMVDLKSRSP